MSYGGGCTHLDLVGIISPRPSIDDPYARSLEKSPSALRRGIVILRKKTEKTLNAGSEGGGCTHLDLVGIISLRPSIDDPYA